MLLRRCLIPLALAASLLGSGAHAGTATIFDSTLDPYTGGNGTQVHPEAVANNPTAGSFLTPAYAGSITSLELGLLCNGLDSITGKPCASGSYSSAGNGSQGINSTTITVNTPADFKPGYFVAASGEIAQGTVYVTGVSGNTVTLSSPVTLTTNEALTTLAQGSFTVSLYANSAASSPTGTTSPDVPAATPLKSFTVYDAQLYVGNNLVAATGPGNAEVAPVLYTFSAANNGPYYSTAQLFNFNTVQLSPGKTYWIELSGSSTPNSGTDWQFIDGNSGTGVPNNYWFVHNYEGPCPSQDSGVCSFLNGGSLGVLHPVSVDMEIAYTPEPASLVILGSALT